MAYALCVSGDFHARGFGIVSACSHLLPTQQVDVFAYLWADEATREEEMRNWLLNQQSAQVRIRRWTYERIRPMNEWAKFANRHQKFAPAYFENLSRIEWGLQGVSQLKCQQESENGTDYECVVHIDAQLAVTAGPPASLFSSILDDHVVLGRFEIMPWFPSYEYGVAIMSSRNMEVYGGLQTMHRRQYIMRNGTVDIKVALLNHLKHAGLRTCSVLMQGGRP